jgi:hypothetical protein
VYVVGGKPQATRSCLSHIDLLQRQWLQRPAAVVGKWLGLLFVYLLPVDCVVIWSSSHCHLL